MRFLFFLPLILLTLGCDDGLKVYSKLEGLRVLGIIADTPEVNSATTVTLTPYVSFPDGVASSSLVVEYEACLDPGTAFGADADCAESPTSILPKMNYSFPLSGFASDSKNTGALTNILVPIPQAVFDQIQNPALFLPPIAYNGIDVLVVVNISDSTNTKFSTRTIKRISLTTRTSDINTNPSFGGFSLSSGPIVAFPVKSEEISLANPSSPEAYSQFNTGGKLESLEEELTASWFSTSGELARSRTSAVGKNEFNPLEDTTGVLVGVLRDNRGGLAIQIQPLP